MIRVYIPATYIPERSYAIQVLLNHFIGVEIEILPDENINHYILSWEDKSIVIADSFFGTFNESVNWIHPRNLPSKIYRSETLGLENIIILYGKDEIQLSPVRIKCGVDLFAGSFFMLTRWEEGLNVTLDDHDRFKAKDAALVKSGFILTPVVDEYVALLRNWLTHLGYPLPELVRSFSIKPTVDVDIPFFYQGRSKCRIIGGILKRSKTGGASLREYNAVSKGLEPDPFDTFDQLMEKAEKEDLRQTFYFISGGKTKYENRYTVSDPLIVSLIEKIKRRGHDIGLHPSYETYRNPTLIQLEKETLQNAISKSVGKSRQHFLRFAVPFTWRFLEESGIEEDSTLGYAEEPGFRCGTSHAFPVFDILERKVLSLMEQPLLVMDVSLKLYKKLTPEDAIEVCEKIKTECLKHNGRFTFIWHNSNLSHIDEWIAWQPVLHSLFAR